MKKISCHFFFPIHENNKLFIISRCNYEAYIDKPDKIKKKLKSDEPFSSQCFIWPPENIRKPKVLSYAEQGQKGILGRKEVMENMQN